MSACRVRTRPFRAPLAMLAVTALLAALGAVATPAPARAAPATGERPLAATPYQGWNTYYGLGGAFDEATIREVADTLVERGLHRAGYDIVWIDGGWQGSPPRDADGRLRPDPEKFPSGMRDLTAYIHEKGLRAGIYTDAGPYDGENCGLGSHGHYQDDADLFAAWGFDAVKVDFLCGIAHDLDPETVFTQFAKAVHDNASGRPMLFNLCNPVTSPDWGDYPPEQQSTHTWSYAPGVAESWRTYTDVGFQGSVKYSDVIRNIRANDAHPEVAGPGRWSDPDYLAPELGMSRAEFRTQLSLWSVAAAPLVIGSDVRSLSDGTVADLTNREVLAIDQDRLGHQGSRVDHDGPGEVWVKRLTDGSRAVALSNTTEETVTMRTSASAAGLSAAGHYALRDVWDQRTTQSAGTITATVPPHETVLLRVSPAHGGHLPPATDLSAPEPAPPYPGSPLWLMPPGEPQDITVRLRNDAATSLRDLRAHLRLPDGWRATLTHGPPHVVPGGGSATIGWRVTPPADAVPGDAYELVAAVDYLWHGHRRGAVDMSATVLVPPSPPAGDLALSAHDWLRATSGWMEPRRDETVGGGPIRLRGVTHEHGIGVASPSEVDYYLGGRCTRLQGVAGIDDAVDNVGPEGGTAVFRLVGDGRVLFDSGVVDRTAGRPFDVDLTGVRVLRLDVGDAGDGGYNDRTDWADLDTSCA